MTEEVKTDKDIIIYTTIDNNNKVIGEFESIDLSFRFEPQDEIPKVLPKETQIAFVLNNGYLLNESSKANINRSPRLNITFDNFATEEEAQMLKDSNQELGRWEIYRCMFDTMNNNNNKIEGVAEGIRFIPETLEMFKQTVKIKT